MRIFCFGRRGNGFNQTPPPHRRVLVRVRRRDGDRLLLPAGHDKTAESAVISVEYGGVPKFLVHHGYGPDGKNPKHEVDRWRSTSKRGDESP